MKILIVSQFYYPERFTISSIASTLKSFGNDVTVITGKPNYGFGEVLPEYKKVKFEVIDGVNVHRVKIAPKKSSRFSIVKNYLSYYFHAKRFARHFDEEYDVVLSVSLSPVISIAPAIVYAREHNVPHVLYCLDLWPESVVSTGAVKDGSILYKILYNWSKSLYKKCDRIIISSPSFKNYFSDVIKIPTDNIKFIPQPPLNAQNTLDPIIYETKHNIVYAGNIGKVQLVDLLVKAMKYLPLDDDTVLHIIGSGSESEDVKRLIDDLNINNKVILHGPLSVDETVRFYQNADALVVSLKNAGYVGKTIPNKLIQYLSYGKPILGVISGDGEVILNKAKGAVICDENEENIASAINKIISLTKEEKETMGHNNLKYFQDNFQLEIVSAQILELLKDATKS